MDDQNSALSGTQDSNNTSVKNTIPPSMAEDNLADTNLTNYNTAAVNATPNVGSMDSPAMPAPAASPVDDLAAPIVPEKPTLGPTEIPTTTPVPATMPVNNPATDNAAPVDMFADIADSPQPVPAEPALVNPVMTASAPEPTNINPTPSIPEASPQPTLEPLPEATPNLPINPIQPVDGVRMESPAPAPTVPASMSTIEPPNAIPATPVVAPIPPMSAENIAPLPNAESVLPSSAPAAQTAEQNMPVAPAGPKKGKGLLIAIIFILVLILGVAGVIFATEAGYWNSGLDKYWSKIGLEKLWGGLPYDGTAALGIAAVSMENISNVHMEDGELSVSIAANDKLPLNVFVPGLEKRLALANPSGKVLGVSIAADASASSDSSSSSTDSTTGVSDQSGGSSSGSASTDQTPSDGATPAPTTPANSAYKVAAKITGDFGKSASDFTISLDLSSLSSDLATLGFSNLASKAMTVQIKTINSKLYLHVPALSLLVGSDDNKWYEVDLADMKAISPVSSITKDLSKASEVVKSGEKVGTEKIDGVNCNKYHLTIDVAKLAQLVLGSGYADLSSETAIFDVWIGKKDHLIHQFNLVSTGSYSGVETQIGFKGTLSKFNVAPEVKPPADNLIDKNGLEGLYNDIMGVVVGSEIVPARAQARDAQRKSDLRSMATALEVYNSDNNAYPVSASVTKSDDATSILAKALVPKYITTMPIDPSSPTYYYGYKSADGKHFELTAVLEETTATGANISKQGDLTVYTLTDTL